MAMRIPGSRRAAYATSRWDQRSAQCRSSRHTRTALLPWPASSNTSRMPSNSAAGVATVGVIRVGATVDAVDGVASGPVGDRPAERALARADIPRDQEQAAVSAPSASQDVIGQGELAVATDQLGGVGRTDVDVRAFGLPARRGHAHNSLLPQRARASRAPLLRCVRVYVPSSCPDKDRFLSRREHEQERQRSPVRIVERDSTNESTQ